MKASFLRLALLAAAMLPAATALAADLDPPPPIEDLRPADYDWTGIHVGVFGAVNAVQSNYTATQDCDDPATVVIEVCPPYDPEMSGIGYGFGLKAGADYQWDSVVVGIVGDWAFGDELADNDDPAQATYMNMPNLATLRARAGYAAGNTLLYLTGGVAAAEIEFGGAVGPLGIDDSDTEWVYGYAIGAGIEHAISESLTVGLEYLYIDLEDSSHFLTDNGVPFASQGTVDVDYEDMHTVRASMTYRFGL
jgi:outer membrane immunogenic protein